MKEEIINEIYLLAVKNKLQRGAISWEDRVSYILGELQSGAVLSPVSASSAQESSAEESPKQCMQSQGTAISEAAPEAVNVVAEIIKGKNKYAELPEEDGFLNRDLQNVKDETHYFEINLTNQESVAYFELISERVDIYKQYPTMIPVNAVEFEGSMAADSKLMLVKKGLLSRAGKLWKIVEPCRMKWC